MKVYGQADRNAAGYVMAALLVTLAVMAVLLSVAMPVWHQAAQREKEEELVFRGKQYVRAIGLFQRKFANTFPPGIDVLVEQKFLRKKYKDPMTADGEFQVLYQVGGAAPTQAGTTTTGTTPGGQAPAQFTQSTSATSGASAASQSSFAFGNAGPRGGIVGVTSKSTALSIRLYNGRNHYNEWQFVYTAPTRAPGGGAGVGQPGQGGRGGVGVGSGQGPGRGTGPGGGGRGPGGPGSIFMPGRPGQVGRGGVIRQQTD